MITKNQPASGQKASYRILVVDDNRDAADSLAMLLEFDQHHVNVCYNGPEAVSATERLRPDVVLLDIEMPGLDGYQTCRLIRQQPAGKDVTIIGLTGYAQVEYEQEGLRAGFNGHLVKPVDVEVITQLMNALLVR